MSLRVRGIRGAITVTVDDADAIVEATRRLLREMVERNALDINDIASVLFSLTPDLHAAFPALAARSMGWNQVPMLHFAEVAIPGAMEKCIRVLMHVNTEKKPTEIEHVYLEDAVKLRPDLVKQP